MEEDQTRLFVSQKMQKDAVYGYVKQDCLCVLTRVLCVKQVVFRCRVLTRLFVSPAKCVRWRNDIKQDCLCHSMLDGGTHQTRLFVSQCVRWRNTSNKIVCVTVC